MKENEKLYDQKFTAKEMHKCIRLSQLIISPNKKYGVFCSSKWNEEKGKFEKNIQCIKLDSLENKSYNLTEPSYENGDINPLFSEKSPEILFFLRKKEKKYQLHYIPFKIDEENKTFQEPIQLTNYPIGISNALLVNNILLFSAEVFYNENMEKSDEKIKEEEKKDYSVYTKTMIRHWDIWYTEGKCTHPFIQKIKFENSIPSLDEKEIDILYNNESDSPPLELGSEEFSISNDNKFISFSAIKRNKEHSWNTKWDIYLYNIQDKSLKIINEEEKGRCQCPRFNFKGNKLSYFWMENYMVEYDQIHIKIIDLENNTSIKNYEISKQFKPFILDYNWYNNDNTFLLSVNDNGIKKLFLHDLTKTTFEESFIEITNDMNFYNFPIIINENEFISLTSNFSSPNYITKLIKNNETKLYKETEIFNPNKSNLQKYYLQQPEIFYFIGSNNEKIQGWIFKPINKEKGKKYPMVFLIHGGPEGSWSPSFSYRWNPQLFSNNGYYVIMINPHGSIGNGIEFQRGVINDWGGKPYEDLIIGYNYIKNLSLNFHDIYSIDFNNVGACGASYGGYMVNWIQGHNQDKKFKCLVNHDGVFSTINMFYATEELWFPLCEFSPFGKYGYTPYNCHEERERFEIFNPERFIKYWNTPQLVIHGGNDFRIPISEGLATFNALQLRNVDSRFVYFKEENHWVTKPENSIKWYDEVIGWLDKYLK